MGFKLGSAKRTSTNILNILNIPLIVQGSAPFPINYLMVAGGGGGGGGGNGSGGSGIVVVRYLVQ